MRRLLPSRAPAACLAALLALSSLLALAPRESAAGPLEEYFFAVEQGIPDGDLSGLVDTRSLPQSELTIEFVTLELVLTPLDDDGFLGDLFATLTHEGGGYAVLLNRPGRDPARPAGYSDNIPISIALSDTAPADIHRYRLTLTGDDDLPLTGPLAGPWQPDGRAVDPLAVVSSDSRTAWLGSFAGSQPGGEWTLFVADVSTAAQYRLESWSLAISLVPEPSTPRLLLVGGLICAVLGRRNPAR